MTAWLIPIRMQARQNLNRVVIEWLDRDGLLAPEWDVNVATDLVYMLTSWEAWELLVIDLRWSRDDYFRHLRTILRRTLVGRRE